MSREIMILDDSTTVKVESGDNDEPIRVRFGDETYGVTLIGDLLQMQRLIVEADRQISGLAVRSNGSPG